MTEEEMKAMLAEKESELAKVKAEKGTLEKNQSEQNAYITKLEETKSGLSNQLANVKDAANKPALDPNITAYFKKKYVEDFVNDGKAEIIKRDTKGSFPILEEELDDFLSSYMNENNASIKFIMDSYSLILGRAIADPEHAINKIEDTGAKSEDAQQQPVQTISNNLFPPTMTNEDQGAGQPAAKTRVVVPDTRSAFKALEEKLFAQGGNKFE